MRENEKKRKEKKGDQFATCSGYVKLDEDVNPRQRTLLWFVKNGPKTKTK